MDGPCDDVEPGYLDEGLKRSNFVTTAFNDGMELMTQCSQHNTRSQHRCMVTLSSLQALTLIYELNAFFFELELLNFPACGFGEAVDPEDILGYWRPFVSSMSRISYRKQHKITTDVPK